MALVLSVDINNDNNYEVKIVSSQTSKAIILVTFVWSASPEINQ